MTTATMRSVVVMGRVKRSIAPSALRVTATRRATEDHGVHSRYKTEPARRLSWQVRAKAFDEADVAAEPPAPDFTARGRVEMATSPKAVTVVTVPLVNVGAAGVMLNGTTKCNQTYSGECCSGDGLVVARVCTADAAVDCEVDDEGDGVVYDAAVAVADDGRSLLFTTASPLAEGTTARWLDAYRTDFPLCAVVDVAGGLAMSPFAFLELGA